MSKRGWIWLVILGVIFCISSGLELYLVHRYDSLKVKENNIYKRQEVVANENRDTFAKIGKINSPEHIEEIVNENENLSYDSDVKIIRIESKSKDK